jgi:hypothetical protein
MAIQITNTQRSSSIIRMVDPGSYNVAISNVSSNANETVNSMNIRKIAWSTNGNISVARGSVPLFSLHNAGTLHLDEFNHTVANNNTDYLLVTITTGGFCLIEVTKDTTYPTPLTGM